MKRSILLFFALLSCCFGRANADQSIKLFDNDVSVAPATRDWKFDVQPLPAGQQVRLSLDARIDWPTLAGSNPWIKVWVNGKLVSEPDLLNKPKDFTVRNGLDMTWFREDAWRVLYSPDFQAANTLQDNPMTVVGGKAYHYDWDITRYVKPGENDLQIYNLSLLATPTTLVMRNGGIVVGAPMAKAVGPGVTPAPTGPLPTYVDGGARRVPMRVLAEAGAMRVDVGNSSFDLSTRTSLPHGAWSSSTSLRSEGRPLRNGESRLLQWQTPAYSVARRIEVASDHVHVSDTFTNTTNDLIGIMVQHRMAFSTKPLHAMVSGTEVVGSALSDHDGTHPSVFAQWEYGGAGLVAEDDVFRAHVTNFAEPGAMGLADNMLGVAHGAPVTLEWSIYPVPASSGSNGDYWDFVNAVRCNWGVNYTIPGPFVCMEAFPGLKPSDPASAYGDWMHRRDLKIVTGDIAQFANGRYAHGTGIFYAPEWQAKITNWVAKVHQGAPDVKALSYFHAQICSEPGAATKYAADRETDDAGKPLSYPSYPDLLLFLPTRGSGYGQALWAYLHRIIDDIGTDGIYWDEMSYSMQEFAPHAPWDGHTVTIDQNTHALVGKYTSVPLLMQPLRLDFVNYLRAHGKYLMANSQAITRTMMQQHIVRFVETGDYAEVIGTNLGCPLGLGNHENEKTQAISALHVRHILEHGGVYCGHLYERDPAAWNFTSVMYPITPARLGPGFVIGRERIHTATSGRFGFSDGAAADVYVVDANGARVAHPTVQAVVEHDRHLYEIRIPSDNFAILVKHDPVRP